MTWLAGKAKAFALFWYDFVVGDDWRMAAGVVLALALTAALTHGVGIPAWWVAPLAVVAVLWRSLLRATRPGSTGS